MFSFCKLLTAYLTDEFGKTIVTFKYEVNKINRYLKLNVSRKLMVYQVFSRQIKYYPALRVVVLKDQSNEGVL